MKKLLIALMLVCMVLLIADPIPIGEGNLTNTHLPMEPFYGFTYSQVIYTAEEIGSAVNIENVAWHYNGAAAWTENEVTVYMGHTTLDEFGAYPSWISITELTEVWSGPFTVLNFDHWVTIDLDTQFAYNGVDNLVIAFDANTSGYFSSLAEFYGTSTTLNRSIWYYDDYTNPDPANPPTTRSDELGYSALEAQKIGKDVMRMSGVSPYIANVILNHDGVLPSGFVNGHVYDIDTNAPIEGATVSVGNFLGTTDASGFYEIEVLVAGTYTVIASHPDYLPGSGQVTVVFDETVTLDLYLELNTLQGDQPGTAIVIDAIPYFGSGDTSLGYTNFIGNASPDVFYALTLTETMNLDINLCGSAFDTYLRIYDTAMAQIAYNDDGCVNYYLASTINYGEGIILGAGSYYICVEGYSSNSGYYELVVDPLLPPAFGNLDGTITDTDGGLPIEGAVVTAGGFTQYTDASGYYQFVDLETGFYSVTATALGYYSQTVAGVEILEDQTTTLNFDLVFNNLQGDTPATAWVIDGYPYYDSGYTTDYTNYIGNSSPDVFYTFTNNTEMAMEIHCCGSTFDTYMYLYDTAMNQIAYDDDGCSSWPTGNTMASWIGSDDGSYQIILPAGTYYFLIEGLGASTGYYECHVDEVLPPEYGGLEGYVTDSSTLLGINGANVNIFGMNTTTNASGWYQISGIETGIYNVNYSATGYNPWTEPGVEILADQNVQVDVALDPLVGVVFEMTVDSYYSEATWNVWDYSTQSLVWATDWGFTSGYQTTIVANDLADGNYEVLCHDTYGDGGIAGVVSKQGVILTQWATNDYTSEGVFPFTVGPILFGGLEGTVTDNFTGDPIGGATVICGNYQGVSDATGYYNMPNVLVGTYDVSCNAGGYTGQTAPVTILEDIVTTQDFALDIIMNPPTNLVATVDGYDVGLTWTAPFEPPTDILHWDDMTNFDAIGLTAGGTFSVAARFTPNELFAFDGLLMTNVTIYINDVPDAMTLYVWTGANAANVLLTQTVTPVGLDWNNFVYSTPITIDASNELWIGYEVTHLAGFYPAGCDGGPAVANYGDMITMDYGVTWAPLSGYGLDYNWNIWGGIAGDRGEDVVLLRPQPWNPQPIQVDQRHELSLAGIGEIFRPFTGDYNVYRNDGLLVTVAENLYDDLSVPAGIYSYYVKAVYDEGESPQSNTVTVELGEADVTVAPDMISETLDYGLSSDHTIMLANNGDGNFYWDGSVQVQMRYDTPEMTPRPTEKVTSEFAEFNPNTPMFEVPEMRDMWDLVGSFSPDPAAGTDVGQAGVEFDGTYFYTAIWSGTDIHKFDIDGNLVETFTIPGVSGLRDLAYDGEYFYGGAAANNLWQMDFTNHTLVSTIASPVAVRAIAYDDDADGFWVNNWSTDFTLVGRDGNIMDSFPCSTVLISYYGLAYDPYTEGGPYLWGYSQAGSGCEIVQYDIATGTETGITYDVLQDVGLAGDIAGGLFTTSDYVDGTFVIGALTQGNPEWIAIYELCPAMSSSWLSIEPTSGTLAPGDNININAHFNANQLPGLTYYADIVFTDGEAMAAVDVDFTITGSIPTPEIVVNPMEFDVIVPAEGTADYGLSIGNLGDLELEYDADIMYYEGRAIAEVYPQSANYWTGTTNGTSFTQTSMIQGMNLEDGWAMFDVSGIPNGAIINSVVYNAYVNYTYYPYWSVTPCTLDPLTSTAAALSAHIEANSAQGVAYAYNNESSTFAVGWHAYTLTAAACTDLAASLAQGWFATGMCSRDNSTSFYIYLDGWNEANPPYLVVDYSIPMYPWVTFGGDMSVSGNVAVGGGANMHMLNFDAAGLTDGDVMMGEIVISSNDLYNEEIVVPVTMTVGQAYMYGDVTGDDVVDAFDAANVLQFTVGMNPVGAPLPWTWQLIAGDVDGNGTPEAYDAALILQYAVGMINVFPVETRSSVPEAEVVMTSENGELVFSVTGELYGFSVITESDLITFNEPEIDYLHAINGNALALANAEAISGEFLRIPFEKVAESGEFVLTMTSNGVSSDHTYNVEDLESGVIANIVFGNYPNPFNPETVIKLAVKADNTPVSINIYNIKGQLVKSLVNGTVESGNHSFVWSGNDNSNRPVSSGVYFYNVKLGELNETHKMIMLK